MKKRLTYPEVVVLHRGVLDPSVVADAAGLRAPLHIEGFTDTHPRLSPLNDGLLRAVARASFVLVEYSLTDASEDYLRAYDQQRFVSHPHVLASFDREMNISTLHALGLRLPEQ